MALFGLLPSKAKATAKTKTLVVVDWDQVAGNPKPFTFLDKSDRAVVWLVYSRVNQTSRWQELAKQYEVVPVQVPNYERNLAMHLASRLAFVLGGSHPYKKIFIVGGQSMYGGLVDFLKEKGANAEIVGQRREGDRNDRNERNERSPRNERSERGEKPERAERNDRNRERGDKQPRTDRPASDRPQADRQPAEKRERRQPEWDEVTLEKYAQKISQFFERKYTPGQAYPRSFFGQAIKQSTGRNSYEVFRTKNAGPFLHFLIEQNFLEAADDQNLTVVKLPTANDILELAKRTTQRTGGEEGAEGEERSGRNDRRGDRGDRRGGRRNSGGNRLAPNTSTADSDNDTDQDFDKELKSLDTPLAKDKGDSFDLDDFDKEILASPPPAPTVTVWDELAEISADKQQD